MEGKPRPAEELTPLEQVKKANEKARAAKVLAHKDAESAAVPVDERLDNLIQGVITAGKLRNEEVNNLINGVAGVAQMDVNEKLDRLIAGVEAAGKLHILKDYVDEHPDTEISRNIEYRLGSVLKSKGGRHSEYEHSTDQLLSAVETGVLPPTDYQNSFEETRKDWQRVFLNEACPNMGQQLLKVLDEGSKLREPIITSEQVKSMMQYLVAIPVDNDYNPDPYYHARVGVYFTRKQMAAFSLLKNLVSDVQDYNNSESRIEEHTKERGITRYLPGYGTHYIKHYDYKLSQHDKGTVKRVREAIPAALDAYFAGSAEQFMSALYRQQYG